MMWEDPDNFEPVRKTTWRDWDGWLLVAYLCFAIFAACLSLIYGGA